MSSARKSLIALSFILSSFQWIFGQVPGAYSSFTALDQNISIMGRTLITEHGNVMFDWPGVSISANFTGSFCAILLDDTNNNFYNVFLDDQPAKVIEVHSDTLLLIAAGLPAGNHALKITKRTEGFQGIATFKGIMLEEGSTLLPADQPSSRKIEFIGNSITCGYGTESENKTDDFKAETENNYKSYAPILCRAFGADYHVIAHSGQGLVRNYGYAEQVSPYTMPDRYLQLFDTEKEPLWDFSSWKPDMVVINLGTNDFSTEPHPLETVFNRAYTNLVKFIRSQYDSIPVFCIVGPMTDEPCYSYVKNMVEGNRTYLKDKNVFFIGIPPYLLVEEDWGAWHPKYSGQIKMAEHIVPVISAVMGWDYGDIR